MLLYLAKHSWTDMAIVTRELSNANNGANPVVFKEILHVIKYVLDTKNLGLNIEPAENANKPFEIVYFSDSDYDEDR